MICLISKPSWPIVGGVITSDGWKKLYNLYAVDEFKYVGSGLYADVYQINDRQVLRFSRSSVCELPNDKHINQRIDHTTISVFNDGETYENNVELFPLMIPINYNEKDPDLLDEIFRVAQKLKNKYRVCDLSPNNFGICLQTGIIKVLDPGCFDLEIIGYFEKDRANC